MTTNTQRIICWCCMKPIIELYHSSQYATTYKLGECCKASEEEQGDR